MRYHATHLKDACIVEVQAHEDERGFFARTYCAREFREHRLADAFVQCSISWNPRKGTLRGLHFQRPPASEAKLVRCTAGALWDVIVDLRPDSPTYLQHLGVELSSSNRLAIYIPEGFAHGFQTLQDHTEVFYQMSEFYAPEHASGLRYNDATLGITWPLEVTLISERDRSWPLLS
jgi:dTDP-4-dehydrorhamnose 3,5-epimerase